MDSLGKIIADGKAARDNYDKMIIGLEAVLMKGSNPRVTPELIARVKLWRTELDNMLQNYGEGSDA